MTKMPELAFSSNADLSRDFTVARVAEKHGWTEPMVWSLALEGKDDLERFKELNWGLRTWDLWDWEMRTRPQLPTGDILTKTASGSFDI